MHVCAATRMFVAAQVADGDAATAQAVRRALHQEDFSAALQALHSSSSAMWLLWVQPAHIRVWRSKVADACSQETAGNVVSLACLMGPSPELHAAGPFLPPRWPENPLEPQVLQPTRHGWTAG